MTDIFPPANTHPYIVFVAHLTDCHMVLLSVLVAVVNNTGTNLNDLSKGLRTPTVCKVTRNIAIYMKRHFAGFLENYFTSEDMKTCGVLHISGNLPRV